MLSRIRVLDGLDEDDSLRSGNRLAFELELDELKELEQLIVQQYPWIESVTESMLVTDITLPDQVRSN